MACCAVFFEEAAALFVVTGFRESWSVLPDQCSPVRAGGSPEQFRGALANRFVIVPEQQLPAADVDRSGKLIVAGDRIEKNAIQLRPGQERIDHGAAHRWSPFGPTGQETAGRSGVFVTQEGPGRCDLQFDW